MCMKVRGGVGGTCKGREEKGRQEKCVFLRKV